MYQIQTGQIFFEKYKKERNYNGSPREFLKDILFPIIYCQEFPLLSITNDPFFQFYIQKKKKKSLKIEDTFETYFNNADKNIISNVTMVGSFSSDNTSTTSGQKHETNELTINDSYYSYIGEALCLNVDGGLSIATFNADLLLKIFDGISIYRKFIEQNRNFNPRQLKTWNTIYILSLYKNETLVELIENHKFSPKETKTYDFCFKSVSWIDLFSTLALNNVEINMISVSNLDKTNSSYGLIPVDFKNIKNYFDFYKKLCGNEFLLKNQNLITHFLSLDKMFIRYLEKPKLGVEILFQSEKIPKKDEIYDNNQNIFLLNLKTTAMVNINNTEIFNKAKEFCNVLSEYQNMDTKARRINKATVDTLFKENGNKIKILVNIKTILEFFIKNDITEHTECINDIISIVDAESIEKVKYFLILTSIFLLELNNKENN